MRIELGRRGEVAEKNNGLVTRQRYLSVIH